MEDSFVIANGGRISAELPCSIEEFLLARQLRPRSVVVEHNGEAVAPSEFASRKLAAGARRHLADLMRILLAPFDAAE